MLTTTVRNCQGLCVFVAVVAAITLGAGIAGAQAGFRVTHAVGRSTPTHVEVTGTVTNETRAEVIDVSVAVEALGPSGKVLARGVTFVASRLPENASAPFVTKVPAAAGVTSYRATVSSYRFTPTFGAP